MSPKATGSKAFENPLISHARMRAMYRALVETRLLAPRLGRDRRLPRNQEACWVGTAIGLEPGDLTSDQRGTAALQHIRDAGQRTTDTGPRTGRLKHLDTRRPMAVAESAFERLLCAAGAAMALRTRSSSVVLAYATPADLKRAEWLRFLAIATRGDLNRALPLVLVVTPRQSSATLDLSQSATKAGQILGRVIPVLPVDAADAVALYRAAQESIGRARAAGGAVIIECVPSPSDPVLLLRKQLIAKRISTPAWCDRVADSVKAL